MASISADEYKLQGNLLFQAGDYQGAIKNYTNAILKNSQNPIYYTNRALCHLRLHNYEQAESDSKRALELDPNSFKGHYHLGMALTQLDQLTKAEKHLGIAYDTALRTGSTMTVHTLEAILELKRKKWEKNERIRLQNKHPLLANTIQLYEDKLELKLKELESQGLDAQELKEEREFYTTETKNQINELKQIFTASDEVTPEDVPIPEYLLDPISFNIFVDPVISKSGQSYERSWILEHLRKNQTDPFSRERLTAADLVPNLGLKAAAEEFINKYGKTF